MRRLTCGLARAAGLAVLVSFAAMGFAQTGHDAVHDTSSAAPATSDHSMQGHDCAAMNAMMGTCGEQGMDMRAMHARMHAGNLAMPGQDAFGAIQEVVARLDADPHTDWSKVNLEALRQHLIDMNEVTLHADANARPVDGGVEIAVTGSGRTLTAIQAMIPAHAREINGVNGWKTKTEPMANGVLLTVTADNPQEVQHIRGLGFIGLLVSGSHHQQHHLAIAKGEPMHEH